MRFFSLVRNDIKSRFAGSRWGFFWALLSPAMTVGIYWFVYTVALRGTVVAGVPYLQFLIAGILPWFFFSEGLTGCTAVFWDYQFLVRNIRFRTEWLPLIRVSSSFLLHTVLMILAYLVLFLGGVPVRAGQLWVFFWMAGGFCLTLALGRIFSLWNACFHDVAYGLSVAIQLGFWLTPIFWTPDSLPGQLFEISLWNPVATLVEGYRQALLFGGTPPLSQILLFWMEVVVLFGVSLLLMKKIKPTLSDRL